MWHSLACLNLCLSSSDIFNGLFKCPLAVFFAAINFFSCHEFIDSIFPSKFLFCIYHITGQKLSPLSFIIGYSIKCFNHFTIWFILALFVMFTHRIIKIMLHCNGICFSGWFVIYLKYFASIFVIFQLFVKWIVGSSVFVSRKSENWLRFW